MSDWEIVLISFAVAGGFFCLGGLWFSRKVLFWRIKWIELEHDLARAQGREPRDISEVEKEWNDRGCKQEDVQQA
jgi:hypothetical protein